MTHELEMKDGLAGYAGCTCHKWRGVQRDWADNEELGAFTIRANDAHRRHREDAEQPPQPGLFEQQQEMFQ